MDYFFGVMFLLYGLIVGSFLNVLIYRLPRKIFFKSSTSYCPNCKHKLSWIDLFPLFSYIFLGGRCRYCKEKISPRYPIVELSNGILWLLSFILFKGDWATIILSCLFFSILLVVAGIDLDISEIPNGLVIAILVLGVVNFVLSFFFGSVKWYEYLIGAVCVSVPFLIIALITGGGIGGGDIKLAFAVGLFLGWKLMLLGTLFGIVIAGIISLILMIKYKKSGMIPLAPSITVGFIISALFGEMIINGVFQLV